MIASLINNFRSKKRYKKDYKNLLYVERNNPLKKLAIHSFITTYSFKKELILYGENTLMVLLL